MALLPLVISGKGLSPYSARGLQQSYAPIQQAQQLKRTVNGGLIDVSLPQFQKFSTTITGSDQKCPVWLWPGLEVEVQCVAEMSFKTANPGDRVRPTRAGAGAEHVDGDYTFYKPVLTCLVQNLTTQEDDYGATVSWTLTLEEK